jgi:hypothetical protein
MCPKAEKDMAIDLESETFANQSPPPPRPSNWLRVALFTAGSVLAGGIAAAWWYRKTLTKLRETGEAPRNSHFGISTGQGEDSPDDDI